MCASHRPGRHVIYSVGARGEGFVMEIPKQKPARRRHASHPTSVRDLYNIHILILLL